MKTKRVVELQVKRGVRDRYLVLSARNILSPRPGTFISEKEARGLIEDEIDVVVRGERQR